MFVSTVCFDFGRQPCGVWCGTPPCSVSLGAAASAGEEDETLARAAAAVRERFGAIAERGRVITRERSLDQQAREAWAPKIGRCPLPCKYSTGGYIPIYSHVLVEYTECGSAPVARGRALGLACGASRADTRHTVPTLRRPVGTQGPRPLLLPQARQAHQATSAPAAARS